MPSYQVILFDTRVERIRRDTEELASLAATLANLHTYAGPWDKYNLKASITNLRDAANRLEEVFAKLAPPVCGVVAAE
jgi:hypothetical protein